jgi:transcriptional regulator with XRE-family HTH domain
MEFNEKLRVTMQELNISQRQLVSMTGIGKSSISQYINGRNTPNEIRQRHIALSLGLPEDYFLQGVIRVQPPEIVNVSGIARIRTLTVRDTAKIMGIGTQKLERGMQQRLYSWGYATRMSENRWSYWINANNFAKVEGVKL